MKQKCIDCGYEMTYDPNVYLACPKCELIQKANHYPGKKYICIDKTRRSLDSVRGTYEENSVSLFHGDTAKLLKLHPGNDGGKCDCGLFEIERTGHVEYYFLSNFEPVKGGE